MKYFSVVLLFIFGIFISGCSAKKSLLQKLSSDESTPYFTGLLVYNPTTGKTLIDYNSDKYFTPASTVKLFALYTALKTLPDSIASISYLDKDHSRYFKTLADPSFLHDSLPNKTYDFLKNTALELVYIPEKMEDFIYGDGWQWDDFEFYYMPEKSIFPIYGNLAELTGSTIIPHYFQESLQEVAKPKFHRDFDRNVFYKDSSVSGRLRKIPFKTSLELSRQLLSDTLHKPVFFSDNSVEGVFKPYVSTPTYPIYKQLMQESENFLAEQLFLIISKEKTGTFKVKNSIRYALDSLLYDMPDKPRWVDASGLSRYNLFTPKSMVYLLQKLYDEFGSEKVFDLLPSNGKTGHLQKWYPYDKTYLYAKTGSVSNNHNLCGYMITKKGTLLIFSYMNNHYMIESSDVRKNMNRVLQQIYKTY